MSSDEKTTQEKRAFGIKYANEKSAQILNEMVSAFGNDVPSIMATVDTMYMKISAIILMVSNQDCITDAMKQWNDSQSDRLSIEGQYHMRSLMEKLVTLKDTRQ